MNSPIFVSGATGNVGSAVIRELMARGALVRAGDRDVERVGEQFGQGVEAVRFDYSDPATYLAAFAGVEAMFLMRPPQISDVERVMFPAMDAAAAAGVKRFVFLSLIGIEQIKRAPHYKVEQRLTEMGVETTFLRCSFFMQNLSTTQRAEIRDRSEIYVPVGKAKTSFVDVRDIGEVAALALLKDGHANKNYDLTGAEALDYYEVADLFSEVLGRKVVYRSPSILGYVLRQLRNRASIPYIMVTAWLYNNTREGMADVVTNEVQRLLGRPPVSMRQFIEDYLDAWK